MEKKNILIVEDDLNLSNMYKIKLENEWFNVEIANNWLESLVKLQKYKPNLILLDLMMPEYDWIETIKSIRLNTSIKPKIIIFSNLDKRKEVEKYLNDNSIYDYLFKADYTPKTLVEKIKEILKDSNTDNKWKNVKCPNCWNEFHI